MFLFWGKRSKGKKFPIYTVLNMSRGIARLKENIHTTRHKLPSNGGSRGGGGEGVSLSFGTFQNGI